jgi:hypothetical protein
MSIAMATSSRRTTTTLRMATVFATAATRTRTHGTTTRNKTTTMMMMMLSRPSTKKMMAFSSSSSSSSSFLGRLWNKYTEALIARPLLVKGGTASIIFFLSDTMTQRLLSNSNTDDDDNNNNTESESESKSKWIWDYNRSLSGAGFGIVATCWLHYWWGFLEIVVNKRLPVCAINGTNKFINTLGKVFLDQVIGAPIYIYSYYCITHFGKEFSKMNLLNNNKENNNSNNDTKDNNDNNSKQTTPNKTTTTTTSELMKETSNRAIEMLPVTMIRHWTIWPAVHTLNFYYNPIHHRVLVQNLVLIFWSGYLSHLNNGGLNTKNKNTDIHLIITPEDEIEMTEESILLQKKKTTTTTTSTTSSLKQRGRGSSSEAAAAAAAASPLATSHERL